MSKGCTAVFDKVWRGRGRQTFRCYCCLILYLSGLNVIYSNILFECVSDLLEYLNPLSLHDALKHHFTSLETDLIFLQPGVLERKFP